MVNTDFSFKVPKIEKVSESTDKKTATFVVEPLERGFGLTLGSSLRRIMLCLVQLLQASRLKEFFMNSAQSLAYMKMYQR